MLHPIQYRTIELGVEGLIERVHGRRMTTIPLNEIRSIDSAHGWLAERPTLQALRGAALLAAGAAGLVLLQNLPHSVANNPAVSYGNLVLVFMLLAGLRELWFATRRGPHLLVGTTRGMQKLLCHGEVDADKVAEFVQTVTQTLKQDPTGAELPDPSAPVGLLCQEELLAGELAVRVYVDLAAGPTGAWVYASEGMRSVGQKELMLTVIRQPEESWNVLDPDVLSLFKELHRHAKEGGRLDVGSWTEFGPTGFLRDPTIRGVLYADMEQTKTIHPSIYLETVYPEPFLTVIAVTEQELIAVKKYGSTRVLTNLGRQTRCYPYPRYIIRGRPSAVATESNQTTMLAKVPCVSIPGFSICMTKEQLIVRFLPESLQALCRLRQEAELPECLALLAGIPRDADACLVWYAGQTRFEVIGNNGSPCEMIAGAYCAFVPKQDADKVLACEDGFSFLLTNETWDRLRNALFDQSSFSQRIPIVLTKDTAPEDRELFVDWATAPAEQIRVLLLTGDKEIRLRLGAQFPQLLATFINEVTAITEGSLAGLAELGASHLIIRCRFLPERKATYKLVLSPKPGQDVPASVRERISRVEVPNVKFGVIELQIAMPLKKPQRLVHDGQARVGTGRLPPPRCPFAVLDTRS